MAIYKRVCMKINNFVIHNFSPITYLSCQWKEGLDLSYCLVWQTISNSLISFLISILCAAFSIACSFPYTLIIHYRKIISYRLAKCNLFIISLLLRLSEVSKLRLRVKCALRLKWPCGLEMKSTFFVKNMPTQKSAWAFQDGLPSFQDCEAIISITEGEFHCK